MGDILNIMKAMADPTRMRLLAILDKEELTVNELVRILNMGQSRISRHLAILKEAGLLQHRREGTSSYYSIPPNLDDHGLIQTFRDSPLYKSSLAGDGPRIKRVLQSRGSESTTYFDRVAESWDDIRAEYFGLRVRYRALAGLIPPDWVVADIGCGTGYLLLALAPLVKKAIGIDNSQEMLRVAHRNASHRGIENIEFVLAEMDDLPLRDSILDGLTASIVLHHAADPEKAVREWARVVRPGGKVSIVELAKHQYDWFREEMADVWLGFDEKELAQLFRNAGFEKIKVEPVIDEMSTADLGVRKTVNVEMQLLTGVKRGI